MQRLQLRSRYVCVNTARHIDIRLYGSRPPSWVNRRDPPPSPYELLGLEENASWERVRAAYIFYAKQLHPDVTASRCGAASATQSPTYLVATAAGACASRHVAADQYIAAAAHEATSWIPGQREAALGSGGNDDSGASSANERNSTFSSLRDSLHSYFFAVKDTAPSASKLPRSFEDVQWAYEIIRKKLQMHHREHQQQQQKQHQQQHQQSQSVERLWNCEDSGGFPNPILRYKCTNFQIGGAAAGAPQHKHMEQQRAAVLKAWQARQEAAAYFWAKRNDAGDTTACIPESNTPAAPAAYSSTDPPIVGVAATGIETAAPASCGPSFPSGLAAAGVAQPLSAADSFQRAGTFFDATPTECLSSAAVNKGHSQQSAWGCAGINDLHASYSEELFHRRLVAERQQPSSPPEALKNIFHDLKRPFDSGTVSISAVGVHESEETSFSSEKLREVNKYRMRETSCKTITETHGTQCQTLFCISHLASDRIVSKIVRHGPRTTFYTEPSSTTRAAYGRARKTAPLNVAGQQQEYDRDRQLQLSELRLLQFSKAETRSAAEVLGLLPPSRLANCKSNYDVNKKRTALHLNPTVTRLCLLLVMVATPAALISIWSSRRTGTLEEER